MIFHDHWSLDSLSVKSIDEEVLKNCSYSALIQPSDHWRLQLVQPDIQILTKSPLIVSESSRTPGRNLFNFLSQELMVDAQNSQS